VRSASKISGTVVRGLHIFRRSMEHPLLHYSCNSWFGFNEILRHMIDYNMAQVIFQYIARRLRKKGQ